MKLNLEMTLAGLAIALIAYQLGKRHAAAAAGLDGAAAHNVIGNSSQWWSYAGQW
ncbi:MAG TPA: hypothetical protein VNO84_11665 [Burkholderiaceae bacterium]|nr:hypothetical protein [Burkholderiaceae bacterium]